MYFIKGCMKLTSLGTPQGAQWRWSAVSGWATYNTRSRAQHAWQNSSVPISGRRF